MEVEARYYEIDDDIVQCLLCPRNCLLKDGHYGVCKTRKVSGKTLISLKYANPIVVHIDPIEKKPLYHYKPSMETYSMGLSGCIFSCMNCQNHDISQDHLEQTEYVIYPKDIIAKCIKNNFPAIAYTYTDPIAFYEYTYDCAKLAHRNNIDNILISAGYVNKEPLEALCKYIHAANIDLKCFSDEMYKELCNGSLSPVLETLKTLKQNNIWLEITNLLIPDFTDDMEMIKIMCGWLVKNGFKDTPLHFSRFFPNHKLKSLNATKIEVMEKAFEIAKSEGLDYVYLGNVSGHPANHTYCPVCKQLLIKRARFAIEENNIHNGTCFKCKTEIKGVF